MSCKKNLSFVLVLTFIAQLFVPLNIAAQDRRLERENNSTNTNNQKRLALIIGNGAYQKVSRLDNPVNDANDMATALQNVGFEVIKGTDTTLVQMRRLIREFGEKLEAQKGIGLFYFAGHGVEVRGKNFLIPVDADISREFETEDYAIDVNTILRQMDAANNGFNIMILDACRNNPFARGWNRSNDTGGLANVNAPTGTYIAYAAAPGTTASDGRGTRNGIFTGALLKNLKRPNLKLEEVFKATREEVMTATGNKQVPWDSSSIKGDFYFVQRESPVIEAVKNNQTTETVITAKTKAEQEKEAWDLVKNSNDAEDFRYFLKEFPTGANADKAKIRLEELVWQAVRNTTDKARVQAYLNEFPNGANASAARIKLRQLEAATTTPANTTSNNTSTTSRTAGAVSKARLPNGAEMNFVYIPAGEFMMGSTNGDADEKPVHKVSISQGFFMGQTEVTQEEWEKVMGNNPSGFKNCARCPVERVSWEDAQQFIAKLNAQNDGFKYRLPTEAEWEYAARAGTSGDYAGNLDSMAWYSANSGGKTNPVGTKQANAWGLYDMHGNVWEWVSDWYGNYPSGSVTDPTGASSGSDRVNRGGSWHNTASILRSADRGRNSPSGRGDGLGFRVVRM